MTYGGGCFNGTNPSESALKGSGVDASGGKLGGPGAAAGVESIGLTG